MYAQDCYFKKNNLIMSVETIVVGVCVFVATQLFNFWKDSRKEKDDETKTTDKELSSTLADLKTVVVELKVIVQQEVSTNEKNFTTIIQKQERLILRVSELEKEIAVFQEWKKTQQPNQNSNQNSNQ